MTNVINSDQTKKYFFNTPYKDIHLCYANKEFLSKLFKQTLKERHRSALCVYLDKEV